MAGAFFMPAAWIRPAFFMPFLRGGGLGGEPFPHFAQYGWPAPLRGNAGEAECPAECPAGESAGGVPGNRGGFPKAEKIR